MKDKQGFERLNVDVLGQERQVPTTYDEKCESYRQRISQTISITKQGFKMIILVLAFGCFLNVLFTPMNCFPGCLGYIPEAKPQTNVIDSHDNSWLEQEQRASYYNYFGYPLIKSNPQALDIEPVRKINRPLHWPWR